MTKWIAVKVFVEQLIIRITRLWAQVLEDKINNNQTKPALNAGLLGVLVKKNINLSRTEISIETGLL
jgi:hypothetical protein